MTTPQSAAAAELQQEIERTRARLGSTVDELAAKADVKAQVRAKAADTKARVQGKATEVKASAGARVTEVSEWITRSQTGQLRWPLGVTGAGVLMIAAAMIWRRQKT